MRANVTITDPAGVTTKLNLPGATLSGDDVAQLIAAVVDATEGARWLVLAGSLPPGAGDRFYVDVIRAVRGRWGSGRARCIAVDTSGAALRAVVDEAAPDLIKPNDEELAELAGVALEAGADLAAAVLPVARALVPCRAAAALVTLGAEGAVLVTADGAWQATPPRIRVVSTVGAGDSSLAGYLLADVAGDGPADRLVAPSGTARPRHLCPARRLPPRPICRQATSSSARSAPPGSPPVRPPDPVHPPVASSTPHHRTTDHWRSSCLRPSRQSWCRSTPRSAPTRRR